MNPLLVVDAANVVGSVPDGWWRDRAGATRRLRDALAPVVRDGLPGSVLPDTQVPGELDGPLDVVLVVEGAARVVEAAGGVDVVAAPGSGDDTVVDVVRDAVARRRTLVATADRELARRVRDLGADVVGPRAVRP